MTDTRPAPIDEILADAARLEGLGQPAEALRAYGDALRVESDNAAALRGRANALLDLGRLAEALADYDRSLGIDPHSSDTHDFKGIALAQAGRLDEALAAFDRALEADPANANALGNRANVLKMLGRLDDALGAMDVVVAAAPGFAVAHFNRANILFDLGRLAEAAEAYGRTAALQPNDREVLLRLAECLTGCERTNEAIPVLERLVALGPNDADAHFALAQTLRAEKRLDAAVRHYMRAAELAPDNADAFGHLGFALADLGRFEDAAGAFGRAAALDPLRAALHYNHGVMLHRAGNVPAALAELDQALALDQDLPDAVGLRLHVAMHIHDWRGLAESLAKLEEQVALGKPMTTPLPVVSMKDDPALHRSWAALYGASVARQAGTAFEWPGPDGHERIRVGYVSADFHDHATMRLMIETLEAHDRDGFEWFGFSIGSHPADAMRERARAALDHFVDLAAVGNAEAVRIMRDCKVDIAVDLKGYTADARTGIFARRVAPIQVNYLGWPGTMAAPFIDYLIADPVLIPEAERERYSEAIVRLPGSYQPNRRLDLLPPPALRSHHDLPQDAFVFCSFNQAYKITPDIFDCWLSILREVPASVLWMWSDEQVGRDNLRSRAAAAGVDPGRLIFARFAAETEHLARLQCADLMLDTLPYNAHTTASDALRVGLPLVTCAGRGFAARVAASLLTTAGLPELIVEDLESYRLTAVEVATNPDVHRTLKAKLRERVAESSLFNPVAAARGLEAAFAAMFERRNAGLAPADIDV